MECSLLYAVLSSLANQASNYLNEGYIPGPMGTLHPNIAPYGEIVKTKDNQSIILAVGSDAQFERLMHLLSIEDLLPGFNTNSKRLSREENCMPS